LGADRERYVRGGETETQAPAISPQQAKPTSRKLNVIERRARHLDPHVSLFTRIDQMDALSCHDKNERSDAAASFASYAYVAAIAIEHLGKSRKSAPEVMGYWPGPNRSETRKLSVLWNG
jgi:hypothetical protein